MTVFLVNMTEKVRLGRIRLPTLWAALTSTMFDSTSHSAAFLAAAVVDNVSSWLP